MTYRLTPDADQDVLGIYAESADRFGISQAEQYYTGLSQCFTLLALQPRMARERTEFNPPIRAHFHGSHVVAYVESDDGILILRVFYSRQDWPNLI